MNRRFLGLLWALLIVIAWPLSVGPARGGSFDLMTTAEATISDIHAALEARQLTAVSWLKVRVLPVKPWNQTLIRTLRDTLHLRLALGLAASPTA